LRCKLCAHRHTVDSLRIHTRIIDVIYAIVVIYVFYLLHLCQLHFLCYVIQVYIYCGNDSIFISYLREMVASTLPICCHLRPAQASSSPQQLVSRLFAREVSTFESHRGTLMWWNQEAPGWMAYGDEQAMIRPKLGWKVACKGISHC